MLSATPKNPVSPRPENMIDRDAIITSLYWCLQEAWGKKDYDKDVNGNPVLLIDKRALEVNKNYSVIMREGKDYVEVTIVQKG